MMQRMFDFDAFEEGAGHDLTMTQGLFAGVSTYYCENCGAIVQVGGPENALVLFHVPRGSFSSERKCVKAGSATGGPSRSTLKEKLKKLEEESYERFRRAANS
jgi:hypothetical protein